MPNINTQGPPIASASNLKIFGMDQNGSTGWISSNTLDSYYNERMAEDFALIGTHLSVEELLTRRSYLIGVRNIFADATGIWYDPQDLTTLFQDAQGTLPVYRPGTGLVDPPVGLMLDKSQGLELGPELCTNNTPDARVWRTSEDFEGWVIPDSVYTFTRGTYLLVFSLSENLTIEGRTGRIGHSGGVAVAPTSIVTNTTPLWTEQYAYIHVAEDVSSFYFTSNSFGVDYTIATVSIKQIKGYHAYQSTTTARPTLSGRYNLLLATDTLATQSVTTVATDYTLHFEGAGSITLSGTATGTLTAGTHTITCTEGSLTCTVAGTVAKADLRVKRDRSGLPVYQSVTDADTYDPVGFPLFLKFDKVDDNMLCQVPEGGLTGTLSLATTRGTASYGVSVPEGEWTIGNAYNPLGDVVSAVLVDQNLIDAEKALLKVFGISKGGTEFVEETSFARAFQDWTHLRDFPLIDTSSGTEFLAAWNGCSGLTSFPELDTSSGTDFSYAWFGCAWLTSFPALDVSSGENFRYSWRGCSRLTSFPALDASSVTDFYAAWAACTGLTSFPVVNVSSGTVFERAWAGCTKLTSFPANFFDSCLATNFTTAFINTNLSQESIDGILVSINSNATSDGTFDQSGGSAPSAVGEAAITEMRSRGWTVTVTGDF